MYGICTSSVHATMPTMTSVAISTKKTWSDERLAELPIESR